MKNLLILIILSIFLFSSSSADVGVSRFGVSLGGTTAGGPDTYYYGVGSDNYPSLFNVSNSNQTIGDTITIGASGSITTIGFKLNDSSMASAKVDLLYDNAGTWTSYGECQVDSDLQSGWNDATLGTPRAVSASDVVFVVVSFDSASPQVNYNATSGGHYESTTDYTSECRGTVTFANSWKFAVRVYVD